MHYILLSIALNLGKENIHLMKAEDLKSSAKSLVETVKKDTAIENTIPILNSEEDLNSVKALPDDTEEFTTPYVESNDFAELLPENEMENIVQPQEEQGPKFLESVKNKLINATTEKNSQATVGDQIEGPTFIDNIKEKILNKNENKAEDVVSDKTETVTKDTTNVSPNSQVNTNLFDKIEDKISTTDIKAGAGKIIDTIKDKTTNLTTKITGMVSQEEQKLDEKPDQANKNNIVDENKVKITGTLFDSELNQAQKDANKEPILKDNSVQEDLSYNEDENYKNFLTEKDLDKLAKPEKILVPLLVPREKELSTFKTQEVPQELLDSRSFQNRHIPAIMQNKEKQDLLEKIIQYGMIDEFKAFMKEESIDANNIMANQYTLLTYSTKYKQYDIMKYLIYKGADVNKRDDRLDTPLLIAVGNDDLEGVKLLTNYNANLDKIDVAKRTPLILAIEKNYDAIAIHLIDNGANIDAKNGIGEGTLAMSIRLGRTAIKDKLLSILNKNTSEDNDEISN